MLLGRSQACGSGPAAPAPAGRQELEDAQASGRRGHLAHDVTLGAGARGDVGAGDQRADGVAPTVALPRLYVGTIDGRPGVTPGPAIHRRGWNRVRRGGRLAVRHRGRWSAPPAVRPTRSRSGPSPGPRPGPSSGPRSGSPLVRGLVAPAEAVAGRGVTPGRRRIGVVVLGPVVDVGVDPVRFAHPVLDGGLVHRHAVLRLRSPGVGPPPPPRGPPAPPRATTSARTRRPRRPRAAARPRDDGARPAP